MDPDSPTLVATKTWMTSYRVGSKAGEVEEGKSKLISLLNEDLEKEKGIWQIMPSLLLLGFSERLEAHHVFAVALKNCISPQTNKYKENKIILFSSSEGRSLLQQLIRLASGTASQTQSEASSAVSFVLSSVVTRSSGAPGGRRFSDAAVAAEVIAADLQGFLRYHILI